MDDNRAQDVQSPFIPITPKESMHAPKPQSPKLTARKRVPTSKTLRYQRAVPTKIMVKNALKTISKIKKNEGDTTSEPVVSDGRRKTITLQGIQKYIALHYFITGGEIKSRMRHAKKYLKELLDGGLLKRIGGTGLVGSFYVPSKSPLNQNNKKVRKSKKSKKSKSTTRRKSSKHGRESKGHKQVRRTGKHGKLSKKVMHSAHTYIKN